MIIPDRIRKPISSRYLSKNEFRNLITQMKLKKD